MRVKALFELLNRNLRVGELFYRVPWMRRLYVRARYDLEYASNPSWDRGRHQRELVELVEKGLVKPCPSIDLGCGKGHDVRYLLSKGFDAWGIDISGKAIRQAIETSKLEGFPTNFIHADALTYVPKEKFSLATDIGLYHIFPKGVRKYLAEHIYSRYLRSGGALLLWCVSDEEPDRGGPHHVSKNELLSFFKEEWEIVEIRKTHLADENGLKAFFMHAILRG